MAARDLLDAPTPGPRLRARVHYEIPDELHRRIKSAAALKGQTLKEFLIEALEESAAADEKQRTKKRP